MHLCSVKRAWKILEMHEKFRRMSACSILYYKWTPSPSNPEGRWCIKMRSRLAPAFFMHRIAFTCARRATTKSKLLWGGRRSWQSLAMQLQFCSRLITCDHNLMQSAEKRYINVVYFKATRSAASSFSDRASHKLTSESNPSSKALTAVTSLSGRVWILKLTLVSEGCGMV